MRKFDPQYYDIAIVGGGLIGIITALRIADLCEQKDWRMVFIAPKNEQTDNRTTALFMKSIKMIDKLGVWEACHSHSSPLKIIRIIDDRSRLIKTPIIEFNAKEMNQEAFGYNIPNSIFLKALNNQLSLYKKLYKKSFQSIDEPLIGAESTRKSMMLTLKNRNRINARFVIAVDGRRSLLRAVSNIDCHEWQYEQTALTFSFQHELPHNFVSNEFHTKSGPITQVPLPKNHTSHHRSSLVWVTKPDRAYQLKALSHITLSRNLEIALHSILGKVVIEEPIQSYPILGMTVKSFGSNRVALAGEAAHVLPPIGAQGLNLGLRDIDDLTSAIKTTTVGDFLNIKNVIQTYNKARKVDASLTTSCIDILNRSLLNNSLLVQLTRVLTLSLAQESSILRRFLMHYGMGNRC